MSGKTPTASGYYWVREIAGRRVTMGRQIVLFTATATEAGGYVRTIGDGHLRTPREFEWGQRVPEPGR